MDSTGPNHMEFPGVKLCRAVMDAAQLASWTSRIDGYYERLEKARQEDGPGAAARLVGPGQKFAPTASSFTIGAVVADEELRAMLRGVITHGAGEWIHHELGDAPVCDADQCWVRRQYAPDRYPRWHAAHGWHQDGALGFDYRAEADGRFPADAMLEMVTCWIALAACGVEAPGLELVTERLDGLLAPGELAEDRVRARFAAEQFWRPALEAGEALLFRGDILHRTQVTPGMTKDRTSIELRFFPGEKIPARLQGDRFINI